MTEGLVARLERLEMIEAARSLVAGYADAVDAQDLDQLAELFAPEALLTTSARRLEGRPAIVDYFRGVFADDPSARRHFITNVRALETSASSATLASYFFFTAGTDGQSILGWGRYVDQCTRIGSEVRFAHKDIAIGFRGPLASGWSTDTATS